MADLVVGLSKTVVQGAISKVQSAIEEDAKLRQKAQRDLVAITLEFEMMQSFLDVAKEESVTNNMVRTWVRHVRELAYDLEDCVEFVVHLDNTPEWWRRLLPSCVAPPLPLDQAVTELEELKRRVEDVNNCYRRYSNISESGTSSMVVMVQQPASSATMDANVLKRIAEAREAAKRRQGLCDLTKLITDKGRLDELQVITMWGPGGDLRMTTSVIWKAYNEEETCQNYDCRAWVKLVRPFNPQGFIHSLISDFYASTSKEREGQILAAEVLKLMEANQDDHLREFTRVVNEQRYLVVLEDLSSMAEWGAIRNFFPNRKNGSSIIVSMQQFATASLCVGGPYQLLELEQFSADHSVFAFLGKGSKSDVDQGQETGDKSKAAEEWMQNHSLVGREEEMNDIHQYTTKAMFDSIQVLSVWGIPGVGKSALVRSLFCDNILNRSSLQRKKRRYFCKYAWVDISHPFDLRDFCRTLLLSFHSETLEEKEISRRNNLGTKNPIAECQYILKQWKCLVVIDGLQSKKQWDLIQADLVSGSSRNCIIIITTEASIAKHCRRDAGELVFNVKGLEADDAFRLFIKEVSWKYPLPSSLADVEVAELKELISKCGGLPKVIVEIANSLGAKLRGRMYSAVSLNGNFMHDLENKREYDSLQGLLIWISTYIRTCPDSLKPCIFYLPVFPRGHVIRRRRLVRRWIAEGYSRDNHEESAEDKGENNFSILLDMCILQQPTQSTIIGDTRMAVCQVNGFMHEYILSQHMEENFVFELGGSCAVTTQRTGRHLTILAHWDRDKIVFNSIDFSRLRSLTVFGKWESFFVSRSMKLLRVLDLEDASGVNDVDLEKMVKVLGRLKFLSLRGCQNIFNLPSSIGNLRQLQTMDVRDTGIVTLPEKIIKLQKLQYIRAGRGTRRKAFSKSISAESAPPVSSSWLPKFSKRRQLVGVVVPEGIGKLTALHTLGVVNLATSGGKAVLEALSNLTQLRKIGVCGVNRKSSRDFFSAISGNVHLETLLVQLDKDNEDCLDDVSFLFANLRSLKLYGLGDKLPKGTDKLSMLVKVDLEMATLMGDDIMFLGKLPLLYILRVKQIRDCELHFCFFVNGVDEKSYEKIKVLEIACGCSSSSLHVKFGLKAMKELELLKIDCCGGSPAYQFSGLENLRQLKQVLLFNTSNAETLKQELKSLLDYHPNPVKPPVVKLEAPLRSS